MLAALDEVAPLLIVVLGMGVVGCVLAILWYRAFAPNNFNRHTTGGPFMTVSSSWVGWQVAASQAQTQSSQ